MRTYLVTGGAGFIGSNYIHYMFRKYDNEIRIINVDALTYAGNLENLKDIENRDNYTFIKADITDKDAIMKIFEENDIDRVVHFAAESHVDRSIKNPKFLSRQMFSEQQLCLIVQKKHGSCQMAVLKLVKSSFMYRQMKYMVHFLMMEKAIFMRQLHISHTVHIPLVKRLLIC